MRARPPRSFRGLALGLALMVAPFAPACEDGFLQEPDSGLSVADAVLVKVSGDEQVGAAGEPLPEAVRVRLVDGNGNPLPRLRIRWTAVNGSVEPRDTFTDEDGIAEASWILGTDGKQELFAVLGSGSPVRFTAAIAR